MDNNEELKKLQSEIQRKKHTESKIELLRGRESELAEETSRLRAVMEIEVSDAEALDQTSVMSIFYTVIGQKVEKLEKEKREALIAAEKYKLAKAELDTVTSDIEKCRKELRYIQRCEERYAELWDKTVKDKANAIEDSGAEGAELNKKLFWLEARIKETEEAIAEGEKVFSTSYSIIENLNYYIAVMSNPRAHRKSSDRTEIQAHEKLKHADNMLLSLQSEVTRFKAELADIDLEFDGEVYSYALAYASNYYADMIAGLCLNGGSVYGALDSTEKIKSDASKMIYRLNERKKRLENDLCYIKKKINNFKV